MEIHYIGHSCFQITTADGVRIVTDPFHSNIGLRMPKLEADIVTLSHGHSDHNNTESLSGDYALCREPGETVCRGVKITGVSTFHDDAGGRKRGRNIVFCMEADGLRICHLGDLGHIPDSAQCALIGRPDILFIPVGEVYTFPVEEAAETVRLLRPTTVIPMHYMVRELNLGLEKVDKFLTLAGASRRMGGRLTVTKETLGRYAGVVVMERA